MLGRCSWLSKYNNFKDICLTLYHNQPHAKLIKTSRQENRRPFNINNNKVNILFFLLEHLQDSGTLRVVADGS